MALRGGELMGELDVTTGFTAAAADVTGIFIDLLPIALGIFALQWGVRKGIQFFKASAN